MTVRVILPLPLHTTYSYAVPKEYEQDAQVGRRVVVELGSRRLTGIIAECALEGQEQVSLKPILDVLDSAPALTEELLHLTRWIADYYVCEWGEVVKTALPSGIDRLEVTRIRPGTNPPNTWKDHPKAGALFRYLEGHAEVTLRGLRQAGIDIPLALLRRLEKKKLLRLETTWEKPKVHIKTEQYVRLASAMHPREAAAQMRGVRQKAVLHVLDSFLQEGQAKPRLADVLARAQASAATVKSLVARGILEISEEEVIRTPDYATSSPEKTTFHTLNEGQKTSLKTISAALETQQYQTLLLHGVTGSGKTEVYIAALNKVLARGQTGIVLVPEIALTHQTVQRFRQRFGDKIAVLHSRMSLGERYDAWRYLRSGRYSVAIGPRSAVLAPLSNIGIIIVDEEHESSYKQYDPAPRYHARDVAVVRARMNKAVCLLGSATPCLESLQNVRTGKYSLLEMKKRIPVSGLTAAPLPSVQIVNLTIERKKRRLQGALSVPLREAIEKCLARKEQIILLQNRRGYAPIIECQMCGSVPTCRDCAVSMTLHKPQQHLRCHYCGSTRRMPRACPECGAETLSQLGTGTQRVEEELEICFPKATVVRMDMDTTHRKNAHHTILEQFGRGDADILLGTQMVAKGLDFQRVTLVGVISADIGMHLPDFRAEERTFQLLMQVAGRSGRAELRGDVILQTRQPDHPVFEHVIKHDFEGFTHTILEERRMLGYPPFGRVVGVEFKGPNEKRVQKVARAWSEVLATILPETIQILGPGPALIERIKKQYRYHIMLKVPKQFSGIQDLLRVVNKKYGRLPRGYRVSIDVDAMSPF